MSLLTVDGCNDYTVLREADVAQGPLVIIASHYSEDDYDLVPGWYRFQGAAGDRMTRECIPIDHCVTYHTGSLVGSHPTVAEGVVVLGVSFSGAETC